MNIEKQDLAILFSGGRDSLAIYALSMAGYHPLINRPRKIHLLHMLNGISRFPELPKNRLKISQKIIKRQLPANEDAPETAYVELDMGQLFQGLWLNRYEELMPHFNGKNLVCVACKLGMHVRAIIYCISNYVPLLLADYTKSHNYFPEQTSAFMSRISKLSEKFGITTGFPLYEEFDHEEVAKHLLEDFGLPFTEGGERKCLFCQTLTTATEKEIGAYLDEMIPLVEQYIEYRLSGSLKKAAKCFPTGRQ